MLAKDRAARTHAHPRGAIGLRDRAHPRAAQVEDNHINQKVACKVLKLLNVQVDVANDGREALEIVSGDPCRGLFSAIRQAIAL